MKHKHYDLIIAWANGAEIQSRNDISVCWEDNPRPMWAHDTMYRIKPEPRPQWQQDLIDASKAGKVVERERIRDGEWYALEELAESPEDCSFGCSRQDQYRIRPEKVIRYLWAVKDPINGWCQMRLFKTEQEAAVSYMHDEYIKIDYTAIEFEE